MGYYKKHTYVTLVYVKTEVSEIRSVWRHPYVIMITLSVKAAKHPQICKYVGFNKASTYVLSRYVKIKFKTLSAYDVIKIY